MVLINNLIDYSFLSIYLFIYPQGLKALQRGVGSNTQDNNDTHVNEYNKPESTNMVTGMTI